MLKMPPPGMNYRQRPRIREEIRSLMRAINGATAAPTQPQLDRLKQLREEYGEAEGVLNQIIETQIQKINDKAKDLPPINANGKNM